MNKALNVCRSCNKTGLIKEKDKEQLERILDLEIKLKVNVAKKMKVPICQYGGILNHDCTEFQYCQKARGPVNIEGYCKVFNNGNPCVAYKENTLGFSEEEEYRDDQQINK